MSAAESNSVLLLFWLQILQEGEEMIAAFEAHHVPRTPPGTLLPPVEDRTRDAWIELWQEIMAFILIFEREYAGPSRDDQRAAARLAHRAEAHFAKLRHALEEKHPGLHAVAVKHPGYRVRSEVDMIESLFAHLVDGFDPNDDTLDAMEEDALARSGLSREQFIAARSRLRGYIDQLPQRHRKGAIAAIKAARRRRN